MAAYIVGRLQMRDPSWLPEYGPKVEALVKKHGGKYIARGGRMEQIEGAEALPSSLVLIEFPSMEHARAWYNDPAYLPMIRLRQTGSDGELTLIEGL